MLKTLKEFGPGVGCRRLHALHPEMPRRELEKFLRRLRRVHLKRHQVHRRKLQWLSAGTVWATDFAVPPSPVDGVFGAILTVRDLASGKQLLWQALKDQSADSAIPHVAALAAKHDAPLVLKSDNGPAFKSRAFRELLEAHRIIPLYSPPWTPRYNGACEASIRHLKSLTTYQASRRQTPLEWTSADLDIALDITNRCQSRKSNRATSSAPGDVDRERFAADVKTRAAANLEQAKLASPTTNTIMTTESAQRRAIEHALHAHGLLKTRSRWVSLPLKSVFCAKIT